MSILKLAPACKDYLWGGTKLITDYGKRYDGARLAETWDLSGHPDGPSVLASGPDAGKTLAEYLAAHPGALGEHGRKFAELPVLIKLIDAAKDLSIQVHPDDAYARAHEGQNGKTEMWYVLSAAPDAFLYCGFSRDISRDELKRRIADNTLPEVLRRVNVKAGDTVFIPAGTIHAICRGIVVAEVQQSSNVTYRVCDYGRLGPDGKPRALHIAQALDVTRRIALHNEGKGAKYTRGRRPVCEIYRECCADRSAALRREAAVKRLSRQQKLQLAASSGQGRGGA